MLLALDLACSTGVAYGPPGRAPATALWRLRETGEPLTYEPPELVRRLRDLVRDIGRPLRIWVEAPLLPQRSKNAAGVVSQYMLHGALHAWAGLNGIDVTSVDVGVIRQTVCGQRNAGDRKATKAMVVRTMHMLRLLPEAGTDDNIADAVCCWAFAESLARKIDRTPLFPSGR